MPGAYCGATSANGIVGAAPLPRILTPPGPTTRHLLAAAAAATITTGGAAITQRRARLPPLLGFRTGPVAWT